MRILVSIFGGLLIGLAAGRAYAFTNASAVLDGAGQWTSGGTYSNISAVAQPGGIIVSRGGTYENFAGFLGTFILRPGLDTDGDGIPDELDNDNDGDTILDHEERDGSAFDPATATDINDPDSDNDGVDDDDEAAAGTNPTDENSLLEITDLVFSNDTTFVTWKARSNKTYVVHAYNEDLTDPHAVFVLLTNTVLGGNAPWYEVIHTVSDESASAETTRFYRVEALSD